VLARRRRRRIIMQAAKEALGNINPVEARSIGRESA
jgi:hypothetical protein